MKAKEYLSQIRKIDIMINQKLDEKEQLRNSLINLSSFNPSHERVQGGELPGDGRVVRTIAKISRLEQEINLLIDELVDRKHQIIEQIHRIKNPVYISLLSKRYIEHKKWEKIANEMNYNYNYVRQIHKHALKEFEIYNTI